MGVVWRAHDRRLHRKVAVKEVLLDAAIDEDRQANRYLRTEREAQTAARLSHHNIVTIYDVVMAHGRPWIVMELIPFPSLETILESQGPLTPLRAARIGQQLLAALTAAHAASVLHRDVKPNNVLVAPDRSPDGAGERAVLTDFGIAQFEGDARLTQTGTMVGTVGFMAPERFDGVSATPASDLWSLGATIYAAVVGNGPFDRATTLSTMSAIKGESFPPAPPAGRLTPLIAGLLHRDPAQRLDAAAAARMFAEIVPLMAAEAVAQRREDTEPSGLPVLLAPPEPLGAPTQTVDQPLVRVHAQPTPPNAGPRSAPDSPELGDDLLKQFDREPGGSSRRSARRVRSRSSAKRVRTIASVTLAILLLAGIGAGIYLLKQPQPSPRTVLSASTPAAGSTSPTAPSSSATPPPVLPPAVAKNAAVANAIDEVSNSQPAGYKPQLLAASVAGSTAGFRLDVPQNWVMNSMGQQTYQYTPKGPDDGVVYVEIDLTMDTKSNMEAEAMLLASQHHVRYPDGYQRVAGSVQQPEKPYTQPENIRGTAGALWQFDYVSNGMTMRMDVLLCTLDQQSYTIYITAPAGNDDNDWNRKTLPMVEKILHTFEPVPA
jgi:serine/threonine protein kinase